MSTEEGADQEPYYPQWEGANQVFAIANCFQNVNHGMAHWDRTYCITKSIEWGGYFVLSCLLGFLLALHCIMYKKINRRCSFKIFKRNHVQILTLSLILTVTLFIKLSFMMEWGDLVLLLMA